MKNTIISIIVGLTQAAMILLSSAAVADLAGDTAALIFLCWSCFITACVNTTLVHDAA